jgi:hypothetical protein
MFHILRLWSGRKLISDGRGIRCTTLSFHIESAGFLGADDLDKMFQFKRNLEEYYCGDAELPSPQGPNLQLQDFKM